MRFLGHIIVKMTINRQIWQKWLWVLSKSHERLRLGTIAANLSNTEERAHGKAALFLKSIFNMVVRVIMANGFCWSCTGKEEKEVLLTWVHADGYVVGEESIMVLTMLMI